MLNSSNPYFQQVELLLALMPLVGPETCFGLMPVYLKSRVFPSEISNS